MYVALKGAMVGNGSHGSNEMGKKLGGGLHRSAATNYCAFKTTFGTGMTPAKYAAMRQAAWGSSAPIGSSQILKA